MFRGLKQAYHHFVPSLFLTYPRLPEDKQTAAFEVTYKIFQQDKSYNKEIRGAAIERVCIPLMRLAGVGAIQNFFKEHIGEMVSTIDAKPTKVRVHHTQFTST